MVHTIGILLLNVIPSPIDYIIARDLIISDYQLDEKTEVIFNYSLAVQSALVDLCINYDIIMDRSSYQIVGEFDPERNRYRLVPYWTINTIRNRYKNLQGAPNINEFPVIDSKLPEIYLELNNKFSNNIKAKIMWELDRKDIYDIVLLETESLREIWTTVYNMNGNTDNYEIRIYLKKLKSLVGDEDFNNFRLPPPVPTWRFVERTRQ